MALAVFGLCGMILWRVVFAAIILFDVYTRSSPPTGDNAGLWPLVFVSPAVVSAGLVGLIFLATRRNKWAAVCVLAVSFAATLYWVRPWVRLLSGVVFPDNILLQISLLDGLLWPLVVIGVTYWLVRSRKRINA